jgi:hypothetical protein
MEFGCLWDGSFRLRDKKVVSVFVRFRAPLHPAGLLPQYLENGAHGL